MLTPFRLCDAFFIFATISAITKIARQSWTSHSPICQTLCLRALLWFFIFSCSFLYFRRMLHVRWLTNWNYSTSMSRVRGVSIDYLMRNLISNCDWKRNEFCWLFEVVFSLITFECDLLFMEEYPSTLMFHFISQFSLHSARQWLRFVVQSNNRLDRLPHNNWMVVQFLFRFLKVFSGFQMRPLPFSLLLTVGQELTDKKCVEILGFNHLVQNYWSLWVSVMCWTCFQCLVLAEARLTLGRTLVESLRRFRIWVFQMRSFNRMSKTKITNSGVVDE
jgi:hypothetical protein